MIFISPEYLLSCRRMLHLPRHRVLERRLFLHQDTFYQTARGPCLLLLSIRWYAEDQLVRRSLPLRNRPLHLKYNSLCKSDMLNNFGLVNNSYTISKIASILRYRYLGGAAGQSRLMHNCIRQCTSYVPSEGAI